MSSERQKPHGLKRFLDEEKITYAAGLAVAAIAISSFLGGGGEKKPAVGDDTYLVDRGNYSLNWNPRINLKINGDITYIGSPEKQTYRTEAVLGREEPFSIDCVASQALKLDDQTIRDHVQSNEMIQGLATEYYVYSQPQKMNSETIDHGNGSKSAKIWYENSGYLAEIPHHVAVNPIIKTTLSIDGNLVRSTDASDKPIIYNDEKSFLVFNQFNAKDFSEGQHFATCEFISSHDEIFSATGTFNITPKA